MPNNLDAARARRAEIVPELNRLANLPGKLSRSQQERWNELTAEAAGLDEQITDLDERVRLAERSTPLSVPGDVDHRGSEYRSTAMRNVETCRSVRDEVKQAAVQVLEQDGRGAVARLAAITSDHDYLSAWSKIWNDPMTGHRSWDDKELRAFQRAEVEYRAMTAGTGSSGGFLVPLFLDPTFVITGTGSVNAFRQVANVKRITTLVYNGSTAAQVTAGLLTENAAFSDNTPVLSQVQITTYKIGAYIPASFEAFEDIETLAADVLELFADAKNNYESTQFVTGTGSAPHGLVADVGLVTASRVAPATGGAYAVADVYSMHTALPARYRNGDPAKRAWMMNVGTIDKTRQFATANNTASFLVELGEGQPTRLLGDQLLEASAMSASYTTGQDVAILGDYSRFIIVDRVGLAAEFIPNVFDQASGRPSGTRAWLMHWRVGSATSDTNGFRLLRL